MTRTIKKYANRRLYDMTDKKYITLVDLKQLVLDDIAFKVVDAKTKEDITQSTLLQILIEQEAGAAPLFTTSLLRNFIKFYETKPSKLFTQQLEQAVVALQKQKDFFKDYMTAYQDLFKRK